MISKTLYLKLFSQVNNETQALWRRSLVAITTAQLHQTESESRLWAGSNSDCDMSKVYDDGDIRQWYQQEIRLSRLLSVNHSTEQLVIIMSRISNKPANSEEIVIKFVLKNNSSDKFHQFR